ncbi:hypothetical protein BDY24DRAFT_373505 [Mrakia frigida]|uniref:uncharacterized protein n=1 Tax=Mrakia frigida TaxID=29902 RepID=UPI003FCBFE88
MSLFLISSSLRSRFLVFVSLHLPLLSPVILLSPFLAAFSSSALLSPHLGLVILVLLIPLTLCSCR